MAHGQQIKVKKRKSIARSVRRRIPVLSFFTGAGLMDIGFEMAGFRVVWSNEYNKVFADSYKQAFSSWRLDGGRGQETEISNTRSISGLDSKTVLKEAFPKGVPRIYGVIGGPPCPDFSQGGSKRGFEGSNGKHTRTYIKLVEALKPTFFLFENVPGLYRYEKSRVVFERLIKKLEKSGRFVVTHKILNALDYGVPQNRERFFLIGIDKNFLGVKNGNGEKWKFPWPKQKWNHVFSKIPWPKTGRFGGDPKRRKGVPEELTAGYALSRLPKPALLPNGKDMFKAKSKKFWKISEGDISGKSFKRLHRHRYSPTAWYGNNEVHLHPWEPRRLSVREAMRLQTIPDSYVFPDTASLSTKFKMIGNGVPCHLAREVASSIKAALKGNKH